MKRTTTLAIVMMLAAGLPLPGYAHKTWLLPSATVSTVDQWVTVDAAVSNDLFYFNHVPLRLDDLTITAPDGAVVQPQNTNTGKYRSTFDMHLAQNGTYRLAIVNHRLTASYVENGARRRWRGAPERLAAEIPANATDLQVSESRGRIETFVTAGAPTTKTLQPTNHGLELVPVTHPNDLYAGEAASLRFLLDGQPAAGLPVTIVPGGTRYRNSQQELQITADDKGEISVTWPAPGMYWLEATLEDGKTSLPQAKQRRVSYVATFEVLPQ